MDGIVFAGLPNIILINLRNNTCIDESFCNEALESLMTKMITKMCGFFKPPEIVEPEIHEISQSIVEVTVEVTVEVETDQMISTTEVSTFFPELSTETTDKQQTELYSTTTEDFKVEEDARFADYLFPSEEDQREFEMGGERIRELERKIEILSKSLLKVKGD